MAIDKDDQNPAHQAFGAGLSGMELRFRLPARIRTAFLMKQTVHVENRADKEPTPVLYAGPHGISE